jgi:hypothetical protein
MEHLDTFEVRQARKALEEAIVRADLCKQLEKIELDEEMGALGWRVLMSVDYYDAWQHCGWIWIKDNDRYVTYIALMNGPPNGHCGFIKLLSEDELKELIIKEAKG